MIPYRFVHFIGVLTPEMTSLALYTAAMGIKVSASDDHELSIYTSPLRAAGVVLYDMFAQVNITSQVDLVVLSAYFDRKHPEVIAAESQKIQVMTATEFASFISHDTKRMVVLDEYEAPLVATFISHVLQQGHIPLQSITNSILSDNTTNQLQGSESDLFLMPVSGFKRDATTYEAAFLSFDAFMLILPSVRYDYPELNITLDDVYDSYYRFAKKVPRKGLIIGNNDYSRMKRLRSHLADRHIETYGFESDATWRIRDLAQENGSSQFSLLYNNHNYGPFTVPFIGPLFIYVAAATIITALYHELKPDVIQRGLTTLPRLKRYFNEFTDREGRLVIDDQSDHPETIGYVLETVKKKYPDKKIWCVYQPMSYLRTKALSSELQEKLQLADYIYIADIHGYPKEKSEGFHARHLVAEMRRSHNQTFYMDSAETMVSLLRDRVKSTDCIVGLGHEQLYYDVTRHLISDQDI